MLWHQRLGHIGEKGIRLLHGKGMVEGMSNNSLDFDLCKHCVYGKKNWLRFPSGAMRAEGILHLVHSDVFGPVPVHHWENICTMSHLYMTSRGKLGYISSGRNLKSLTDLKSLRLLLRIKQRNKLRC